MDAKVKIRKLGSKYCVINISGSSFPYETFEKAFRVACEYASWKYENISVEIFPSHILNYG